MFWKMFGVVSPGKAVLPGELLIAQLNDDDLAMLRKRFKCVSAFECLYKGMSFEMFTYYRNTNPRQRRQMFYLYGANEDSAVGVKVAITLYKGQEAAWISYFSLLKDGRVLVTANHHNAGVLRHPPETIVRRVIQYDPEKLLSAHRATVWEFGSGMRPEVRVDEVADFDRQTYRANIDFKITSGLLIPDSEAGTEGVEPIK
jgi:hypothetical protein